MKYEPTPIYVPEAPPAKPVVVTTGLLSNLQILALAPAPEKKTTLTFRGGWQAGKSFRKK